MTKKRLGSERTREALLLHVWQTRDSARALAAHEREIAAEALEKAARTIVRETRRIAMMPSCARRHGAAYTNILWNHGRTSAARELRSIAARRKAAR